MSDTVNREAANREPEEHVVGPASELKPGERKLVQVRTLQIAVYNVNGSYYAWHNMCPHQYGPACSGPIGGEMICGEETDWRLQWTRDGEILTCPWHGMEFDILTGQSLTRTDYKLRGLPVRVVDGEIRIGLRVQRKAN